MPWPSKDPADYSPAPPREEDDRPPASLRFVSLMAVLILILFGTSLTGNVLSDDHPTLAWLVAGIWVLVAVAILVGDARRRRSGAR